MCPLRARPFAPLNLLIEEAHRLDRLGPVARGIPLDEQIDQFLDDIVREPGILGIGEPTDARFGRYLEEIVRLGDDRDAATDTIRQHSDIGIAGNLPDRIGAADHLDQILVGGQRLAGRDRCPSGHRCRSCRSGPEAAICACRSTLARDS